MCIRDSVQLRYSLHSRQKYRHITNYVILLYYRLIALLASVESLWTFTERTLARRRVIDSIRCEFLSALGLQHG